MLLNLSEEMAKSPETILQKLAETILHALDVDSAGISLLSSDGKSFVWPAVIGALAPYVGEGTPRDFGPCGDVLDNNCPILFKNPARRYHYINQLQPTIEEVLLVPFYFQDEPVGTVWAVSHCSERLFDSKDLRILKSLANFASSAYWTITSLKTLKNSEVEERRLADELLYLHQTLQAELKNQLKYTADELSRSDDKLRSIALLVSQQIQEPAKVMSSYLKLLAVRYKGRLGSDADEFIQKCLCSSTTIVRMLDDLWYYTRANRQVEPISINLMDCLDGALRRLSSSIENNNITIKKPETLPEVICDFEHIQFVFKSLIEDSINFKKANEASQITISCTDDETESEWLICVEDQGIGIDVMSAREIFKPFVRLNGRANESGTGRSLSISQRMIAAHKGKIWVEAKEEVEEEGAKFFFTLPKKQQKATV